MEEAAAAEPGPITRRHAAPRRALAPPPARVRSDLPSCGDAALRGPAPSPYPRFRAVGQGAFAILDRATLAKEETP